MKKPGIKHLAFVAIITLSATVAGLLLAPKGLAVADSCTAPATTYGTDTMTLNIPTAGTYTIWTRMQIPDTTDASILMNVDNKDCFDVGGYSAYFPLNTWTWIQYSDADGFVANSATLSAGAHTLTFTGIDPGVSIDRIEALSDPSCTPTGTGDNCTPAVDTTPPTATITSAPAATTNSTSASFSFTGADNQTATASLTYECSLDSAAYTACTSPKTYTGLASGSHSFGVKSIDAAGNVSTAATDSWTIDTTPPTISISAPTTGSTVSGTVTVSATSSGAASVQFKLDGANLGSADTTSPYSVSWTTTTDTNASHTLTAVATDAAGNTATSSPVTVIVNNSTTTTDTTPPSVPAGLAVSTNLPVTATTAQLSWNASTDNTGGSGLAGYKLYRSGTLIATLGSTTLSYLDTGLTVNTAYSYTVAAYDNAGNISAKSTPLAVTSDPLIGDLDGDDHVTGHDVSLLLSHYNTNYPQGEFDGTTTVEGHDVSLLLSNYGK